MLCYMLHGDSQNIPKFCNVIKINLCIWATEQTGSRQHYTNEVLYSQSPTNGYFCKKENKFSSAGLYSKCV